MIVLTNTLSSAAGSKSGRLFISLAAAAVLGVTAPAFAAIWTGAGTNWNSNGNPGWNGTGVPDAVDAVANIAAAAGNITVNGAYTLGTLTAGGTYAGRTLATSSGSLNFDVSGGSALFDLTNGMTNGSGAVSNMTIATNLILSDPTEIRALVSTGSITANFNGVIGGASGLVLTNVATAPIGGARITLNNGANVYAGGTNVGQGVALRVNASGALGSGAVVFANTPGVVANASIDFRQDGGNTTQIHPNNIDFGTHANGSNTLLALGNASMNVTLTGVLSNSLTAGRASLSGGTLILGGTSPNTWTGTFRSDSTGTLIADKVGALPAGGVSLRSTTANSTTSLLVGVADTITGAISADGNNAGQGFAYAVRIGLKDGNNGAVTFSNASKINLVNTWGVGGTSATATTTSLILHSGNGNGVLNVATEIGTNPTFARSISVTGSGTVNLNRAGGNTYGGATSVLGGTLLVNNSTGSATSTGAVNVASGAAIGGTGIVGGLLVVDGSVRPGNGIGTLTVASDVLWNAGTPWAFELATPAASLDLAASGGSTQDLLNITGNGSDFLRGNGSAFTFDFANTGTTGFYKLVDWAGTTDFTASAFIATGLPAELMGSFTVDPASSALYLSVTPVPEPTVSFLACAAVLATSCRRRRA